MKVKQQTKAQNVNVKEKKQKERSQFMLQKDTKNTTPLYYKFMFMLQLYAKLHINIGTHLNKRGHLKRP